MKSCLFCFALICIAIVTEAQTEKGNFLIGGGVSASRSSQTISSSDITSTSFGLTPSASYFVVDRFAAGLITSYSVGNATTETAGGSVKTSNVSSGIGPTIRYYLPLGEKIWLFPEVDYLWNWNHSKIEAFGSTPTDSKSNSQTFRIGPGLAYFIAKNVGVEGILYYQNVNNNNTSASTSTSTSSINFRIGLQIYILRNKG
ncbi:MAG TPA: outer membrane beta-barrel protein [Cyclobacteriaceae bacterium]|nr:outer membrane beta-barrel protein [Cyclobacteriaceae bacterium]